MPEQGFSFFRKPYTVYNEDYERTIMLRQLDCPNCKSDNAKREPSDANERRCVGCGAVWDIRDVEDESPK